MDSKDCTERGHAHLLTQVSGYYWLLTSEHRITGPSRKYYLGMTSAHMLCLSASIPGSCTYPVYFFKLGLLLTKLKTPQKQESCHVLIFLYYILDIIDKTKIFIELISLADICSKFFFCYLRMVGECI